MASHYWWSEPEIPIRWATEHFLVAGATGSGKTVVIRCLMHSVLTQGANRRAIVFDAKREAYPILKSFGLTEDEIRIFNPFDARSVSWDLSEDIDDFASAEEFASILIPSLGNESQPFFRDASRYLLAAMTQIFICCRRSAAEKKSETCTGRWTLRDVVCAMRLPTMALKELYKAFEFTDHALLYFESLKTLANIRSSLDSLLSKYAIVASLWDHGERAAGKAQPLSLKKDWIENPSIIVVGREPTLKAAIEPLNQLFLQRAMQMVLALPERSHSAEADILSWFFLDELKAAGRLELLPDFMSQGRSKAACVVIGIQNVFGVVSTYGESPAMDLLSQCANKALLRMQDTETAAWAASLVGERYVIKITTDAQRGWSSESSPSGESRGRSGSEGNGQAMEREPTVTPSTFWYDLKPTSQETGLEGFFFIANQPKSGKAITHIAGDELFKDNPALGALSPEHPATVARPPQYQELRPWSMEDLQRLGLEKIRAVAIAVKKAGTPVRDEFSESEESEPEAEEDLPEDTKGNEENPFDSVPE